MKKSLSVFDKHQLAIAYSTMKMSDVGARIMGGMTKEEAKEIIKKFTGKEYKESYMTKAVELINMLEESEGQPREVTAIYDVGDDSYADRYTVLFSKKSFPDVSNPKYVMSLGMSSSPTHPQGVSQWGEALPGSHLGKKIKWSDLPDNVRKHVIDRLKD